MNKNYGIVLIVLAGVVLLGVLTHWTYPTWKIIDWVIIVVCGYIGYKLYKEHK